MKNGWRPLHHAYRNVEVGTSCKPGPRVMLWVVGYGVAFGRIYSDSDSKDLYVVSEQHHGNYTVRAYQPIPKGP